MITKRVQRDEEWPRRDFVTDEASGAGRMTAPRNTHATSDGTASRSRVADTYRLARRRAAASVPGWRCQSWSQARPRSSSCWPAARWRPGGQAQFRRHRPQPQAVGFRDEITDAPLKRPRVLRIHRPRRQRFSVTPRPCAGRLEATEPKVRCQERHHTASPSRRIRPARTAHRRQSRCSRRADSSHGLLAAANRPPIRLRPSRRDQGRSRRGPPMSPPGGGPQETQGHSASGRCG